MKTALDKDTKTMENKKVEVSAIITKVENNPSEITFFTPNGDKVPQGTQVQKEASASGTKFFAASPNK